jgi:hypothetical protein
MDHQSDEQVGSGARRGGCCFQPHPGSAEKSSPQMMAERWSVNRFDIDLQKNRTVFSRSSSLSAWMTLWGSSRMTRSPPPL